MTEKKLFPVEFNYKGTEVTIEYDEMCYKYLANYTLGIIHVKDEFYSLDDAIDNTKRQIDNEPY